MAVAAGVDAARTRPRTRRATGCIRELREARGPATLEAAREPSSRVREMPEQTEGPTLDSPLLTESKHTGTQSRRTALLDAARPCSGPPARCVQGRSSGRGALPARAAPSPAVPPDPER